MVGYGHNHTKDKRASKIRVFILPLKMPHMNNNNSYLPGELNLYGLYVYYVVHFCDFGMLTVKIL